MPVWGVRPQVLSLLLTSLWLLILERSERNPKLLWWTLPLTLLWVNLHAGFALGLALSALFLAGELVERVARTLPAKRVAPSVRSAHISPRPTDCATQSQRPADVLLPDRDSAVRCHAELHRRMGLTQFPSCRVLAFPADGAVYVRSSELVSPPGAPAGPAPDTRKPVRGPVFDPHDAVVRFDRGAAHLPAAPRLVHKPIAAVASDAPARRFPQWRDRAGDSCLCRRPNRPCDPATAPG